MMNEFDKIVREHFDISDNQTRKFIVSLDEGAEENQLLAALANSLYEKIVQKADKIDFGSIPNSRGDITKVEGFENTMECLNIIRRLVVEYRENPEIVDTVITAVENIKTRKPQFTRAFATNVPFATMIYCLIVLSIEQAVSFLISTCIQYIKDPASQDIRSALDKVAYNNTKENLLYEQLVEFNRSCQSKEMDLALEQSLKHGVVREDAQVIIINPSDKECCDKMPQADEPVPLNGTDNNIPADQPVNEGAAILLLAAKGLAFLTNINPVLTVAAVAGGGALLLKLLRTILKSIIPMMRNIVYFWYNSKVKVSDCLAVQAQLIESNAYNLQFSTVSNLTDEKRAKAVEKQLKVAEKLKVWSNKFAIDNNKSKKQANEMIADDNKLLKINDIKGNIPNNMLANASIF